MISVSAQLDIRSDGRKGAIWIRHIAIRAECDISLNIKADVRNLILNRELISLDNRHRSRRHLRASRIEMRLSDHFIKMDASKHLSQIIRNGWKKSRLIDHQGSLLSRNRQYALQRNKKAMNNGANGNLRQSYSAKVMTMRSTTR